VIIGSRYLSASTPERRVDAGTASSTRPARRATFGHLEPGVQPFRDLISDTPEQYRPTLTLMADWTEELALTNHNITAATYFGLAGDVALLPRLKDENVGLVTLWRYHSGKPAISFWRSVFERRAPQSVAPTEQLIGKPIRPRNDKQSGDTRTSHRDPECLPVRILGGTLTPASHPAVRL
jgi:hypothetical protein